MKHGAPHGTPGPPLSPGDRRSSPSLRAMHRDADWLLPASRWQRSSDGRLYLCGTAFGQDGSRLDADGVLASFSAVDDADNRDAVADLNGFFALVHLVDDRLFCAVDRARSIPLFYGIRDGKVAVSDRAELARRALGLSRVDGEARTDFRASGHVHGHRTLVAGLQQLRAAESIAIDAKGEGATSDYMELTLCQPDHTDPSERAERLWTRVQQASERLLAHADGRRLVLPLSGGYDSRLIAVALRECGAKNVLAFSYGARDHAEVKVAHDVAQALGMKWLHVRSAPEDWSEPRLRADLRDALPDLMNHSVSPHLQDFVAVHSLVRSGAVVEGDVVVPGHSGDILSGRVIPREVMDHSVRVTVPGRVLDDPEHAVDWLTDLVLSRECDRSVTTLSASSRADLHRELSTRLGLYGALSPTALVAEFMRMRLKEQTTKYIVNSVRTYEHFGLDWWMPLWDAGVVDHLRHVPLEGLIRRREYVSAVQELYAGRTGGPRSLGNAVESVWQRHPRLGAAKERVPSSLVLNLSGARQRLKSVRRRLLPGLPARDFGVAVGLPVYRHWARRGRNFLGAIGEEALPMAERAIDGCERPSAFDR